MSEIQPLLENILAKPIQESVSKGGLVLPDALEETQRETGKAEILSVGQGIRKLDGGILPLLVKKGDVILFSKCAPIVIDQEKYLIIKEEWVLAIVKDKKDEKTKSK